MSWFHAMLSAGGGDLFSISGFFVKYNNTDYSYITSKAGYSDTGSFLTGGNVIELANLGSTNQGLFIDPVTDRIASRNGSPLEYFTRAGFSAAAAAAAGTLPTVDETITFSGTPGQGVSFDPVNSEYYVQDTGGHKVTRRDLAGNILETIDFTALIAPVCDYNYYDAATGRLYIMKDNAVLYAIEKISGVWTLVLESWYNQNEGGSIDYISDRWYGVAGNDGISTIRSQTPGDGTGDGRNIAEGPFALASQSGVVEGLVVDPKDGTIWYNSDQFTHGGITNGNRLWHTDRNKWYLKYYRNSMDEFSTIWKLGGNSTVGRFGWQELTGAGVNYSLSPVFDFGAFTAQQTAGNWGVLSGTCEMEFRGSASAPDTTPENTVPYHSLVLYDANGSNDGWGTTVPGAWQSTPTTDRYMQCRIRPVEYVPPVVVELPADVATKGKFLFEVDRNDTVQTPEEWYALANTWYDVGAITKGVNRMINLLDIGGPMVQITDPFRPQWLEAGLCVRLTSANQYLAFEDMANWFTQVGTECEINVVMRKPAASSRAVALGLSQSTSNVNDFRLQHTGSGNSPANYLCWEYTDSGGTVNRVGITDTSNGTFRLISWVMGQGSENEIYVNKVKQTLTINAGANTGQGFDLLSALSDMGARINRVQRLSSSVNGNTDIRIYLLSTPLTAQERSDFYDYCVAKGYL